MAEILIELADDADPSVRLPLGSDTIAAIEAKHSSDAAMIAEWRAVATSTDTPS